MARTRAARGPQPFVQRGRASSAGASTSSHPQVVRATYYEQPDSKEDLDEDSEEDPEGDSDEDPDEDSEESSEGSDA